MIVQDFITTDIVPLNINSTVEDALNLADTFLLTHVPLFNGLNFIGSISLLHLKENDPAIKINTLLENVEKFSLKENQTVFDAIEVLNQHESNVAPILNEANEYLGNIVAEDVLLALQKLPFINEPSAMLTVKIPTKQFSMSEVAKIVESNNGRIFGVFVSSFRADFTEITVRFNAENLSSVVATFERFGYHIEQQFFNDHKVSLIKNRYEQLMSYLNV